MAALAEQEPELDGAVGEEALNRRRSVLLLALACGAVAAQQEPAPPAGSALLSALRASSLTLEQARALVPQLLAQPIAIRLPASDALRAVYLEQGRRHAKTTADLQRSMSKVAAALLAERLGKHGATEVEALRREALAISRAEDLTEQRIRAEIDPRLQTLAERLWPEREQFIARDPEIAALWATLQQQRVELVGWHAAYVESVAGLELHPQAQKHFAKTPPPPAPAPPSSLDDEWLVWTLLAAPLSARDRKTLEQNELLRAGSDAEEFAGTTALNRRRFLLGLPLLRIDERLARCARDHSADMRDLGFFDHTSPVPGKRTPGERAARFGTSGGAENIAAGHSRGEAAVQAWWYSPGHHKNLLGNHARTGIGRCDQLWTQMFGG